MILAIDTSLGTAVAVVERDGGVLAETGTDDTMRHAEVIGGSSARRSPRPGVRPRDLSGVAAGMGPGPFTGLRVGIAAARAFALGRGIPVVPVASHDAVALGTGTGAGRRRTALPVVTDARRREFAFSVYAALDDDGLPIRVGGPALDPARRRVPADAGHAPRRAPRSRRRCSACSPSSRSPRAGSARRRRAALPALARCDALGRQAGAAMSVLMRRATLDDLDAIMALERASFPTDAWSER